MQAKGDTWSPALETQLCYEVKTFLLAGHETSAAMLTWTLYELTRRPDMLAKVRLQPMKLGALIAGFPMLTPPAAVTTIEHVTIREMLYVKHLHQASCEQVRQEAEAAFGRDEEEPSRHAAEQMIVTVSSLKVDSTCLPRPTSCVGTCTGTSLRFPGVCACDG